MRGWRVAVLSTNKTAEKKCERLKNTSVWRCWLQLHLHAKHGVKKEAVRQAYQFLPPISNQCSPVLRLFLCSICAPTCQPNVTDQISPCHSLFTQGKRGCAPVICQYGFRWPKTMRCRHFPKANGNRLRVDRNAMVRNSASIITLQQKISKRTKLAEKLWRMVFHPFWRLSYSQKSSSNVAMRGHIYNSACFFLKYFLIGIFGKVVSIMNSVILWSRVMYCENFFVSSHKYSSVVDVSINW